MSQQRQIAWSDRVHRDEIPGRLAPLAMLPGKFPRRIFPNLPRRWLGTGKSAGGCSKCCRRGRPASRTGAVSPLTQSHAPPRWDRPAVPAVWGCRGSGSWVLIPRLEPRTDRGEMYPPSIPPTPSPRRVGAGASKDLHAIGLRTRCRHSPAATDCAVGELRTFAPATRAMGIATPSMPGSPPGAVGPQPSGHAPQSWHRREKARTPARTSRAGVLVVVAGTGFEPATSGL